MKVEQLQIRRSQPSESREIAAWIKQHHYLKSTPPGYVLALEYFLRGKLVGAHLVGRPANRNLDADRVLELTRAYFLDEAPKNCESQALAMMRKHIRTWLPNVRLLISYSDPEQGHTGAIYEADGWAPFGMTDKNRGYGWKSQKGRRSEQLSRKQRWVRTP